MPQKSYEHIVGKRFGEWLVDGWEYEPRLEGGGNYYAVCTCSCGKKSRVSVYSILKEKRGSKSCGCKKGQFLTKSKTQDGRSKHPLYSTWLSMVHRCTLENDPGYASYGGRGIKVCDRWSLPRGEGFRNFITDMGERPEGMTLDRANVNGDYCPENCRWATQSIQSFNKRKIESTERTGVRLLKNGKWVSRIKVNRKHIHLGYFSVLEEAVKAREDAELKYFGFIKE